MNLESIVPSLETCRQIPQGAFKDSALVWMAWHTENIEFGKVVPRSMLKEFTDALSMIHAALLYVHPAPTLAEILAELPTVGCIVCVCEVGGNVEYTASLPLSDIEETNTNPATAALRLWLSLKGVQG